MVDDTEFAQFYAERVGASYEKTASLCLQLVDTLSTADLKHQFIDCHVYVNDPFRCGMCFRRYCESQTGTHAALADNLHIRICAPCCLEHTIPADHIPREYLLTIDETALLPRSSLALSSDSQSSVTSVFVRRHCELLTYIYHGGRQTFEKRLAYEHIRYHEEIYYGCQEVRAIIDQKLHEFGYSVTCHDLESDDDVPLSFARKLRMSLYGPRGMSGLEYLETSDHDLDMAEVLGAAKTLDLRRREEFLTSKILARRFQQSPESSRISHASGICVELLKLCPSFKKFICSAIIPWSQLEVALNASVDELCKIEEIRKVMVLSLKDAWVQKVGQVEGAVVHGRETSRKQFVSEGLKWCMNQKIIDSFFMLDLTHLDTSIRNAQKAGDQFWRMLAKRHFEEIAQASKHAARSEAVRLELELLVNKALKAIPDEMAAGYLPLKTSPDPELRLMYDNFIAPENDEWKLFMTEEDAATLIYRAEICERAIIKVFPTFDLSKALYSSVAKLEAFVHSRDDPLPPMQPKAGPSNGALESGIGGAELCYYLPCSPSLDKTVAAIVNLEMIRTHRVREVCSEVRKGGITEWKLEKIFRPASPDFEFCLEGALEFQTVANNWIYDEKQDNLQSIRDVVRKFYYVEEEQRKIISIRQSIRDSPDFQKLFSDTYAIHDFLGSEEMKAACKSSRVYQEYVYGYSGRWTEYEAVRDVIRIVQLLVSKRIPSVMVRAICGAFF
ncbi:hypothetical protein HDV05_008437 [Chytridiales sp. JEL 0842]|nr:hypothetical protein HDV05_008437 [Chytridiales sp. JEL 0842]